MQFRLLQFAPLLEQGRTALDQFVEQVFVLVFDLALADVDEFHVVYRTDLAWVEVVTPRHGFGMHGGQVDADRVAG